MAQLHAKVKLKLQKPRKAKGVLMFVTRPSSTMATDWAAKGGHITCCGLTAAKASCGEMLKK